VTDPNWNVAIVDGQPEQVVNTAGLAALVRMSPLGVNEAMRRLQGTIPAEAFADLQAEMKR
jgi:hypothetical protein